MVRPFPEPDGRCKATDLKAVSALHRDYTKDQPFCVALLQDNKSSIALFDAFFQRPYNLPKRGGSMEGPRFGAHMSIAGGPAEALRRGRAIGCDTIQIFTRPANRWVSRDLTPEEIAEFERARAETGIAPIVAHSSYLINLASPDPDLWEKSYRALIIELERCAALGIREYVLHPGSHRGEGVEKGLSRVQEALTRALEATAEDGPIIVLETTAGQGDILGCRLEHLAFLLHHVAPRERLGICVDTAHLLAAGYEFRYAAAYAAFWAEFDRLLGREALCVIHVNDSKRDLGSQVDRHEHIGQGCVGLEAFRLLVNDRSLWPLPMILETPKGPEMEEDIRNLALLRSLVETPPNATTPE